MTLPRVGFEPLISQTLDMVFEMRGAQDAAPQPIVKRSKENHEWDELMVTERLFLLIRLFLSAVALAKADWWWLNK